MTLVTLQPGDLVCDYATPKNLDTIKKAGYKGIARYLWDGWKGMSETECREILANGFVLWGIYEASKDRAFSGAVAGTADGKRARQLADRIGFQGFIVWTLDTDAYKKEHAPAVIAYGRAFEAAAKAGKTGAYVDGEVTALMSGPDEFSPIWTPMAGWWSRLWPNYRHPWTHIIQQKAVVPGTDHGVVLRTCVGWTAEVPGPIIPAPWVPTPPLRRDGLSAFVYNVRVQELQHVLAFWGFFTGTANGRFGRSTERAVKRFQEWLGMRDIDGFYGPYTASDYRTTLDGFRAPA